MPHRWRGRGRNRSRAEFFRLAADHDGVSWQLVPCHSPGLVGRVRLAECGERPDPSSRTPSVLRRAANDDTVLRSSGDAEPLRRLLGVLRRRTKGIGAARSRLVTALSPDRPSRETSARPPSVDVSLVNVYRLVERVGHLEIRAALAVRGQSSRRLTRLQVDRAGGRCRVLVRPRRSHGGQARPVPGVPVAKRPGAASERGDLPCRPTSACDRRRARVRLVGQPGLSAGAPMRGIRCGCAAVSPAVFTLSISRYPYDTNRFQSGSALGRKSDSGRDVGAAAHVNEQHNERGETEEPDVIAFRKRDAVHHQ